MKQFLSALLFLMIIGCKKQDAVITFAFQDQPEVKTIVYSAPISGTSFWSFSDTLIMNETGELKLNLNISQPSFVSFFTDKIYTLLVEPGKSYHVSIDAQKNIQITGADEQGQMLYATLPNPGYIELEFRKIGNPYNDSTSLTLVHNKINDLKQAELSTFKELFDNKKISKSYFYRAQKDRDFFYAAMEARFLIIKTFNSLRLGTKIDDELLQTLGKIYDQYPPNDEKLLFSHYWTEYADNYVGCYKQYIKEDFDSQKVQDLRATETYHMQVINESKKYLSGKARELFYAGYLDLECIRFRSVEKEFIALFEQFEMEYPQSKYTKYLKPYFDKTIDYHRIISLPPDPAILFMDNYEAINTLEEAIKPFRGKKIYVDVWASWCGPCKEEFSNNESLKKILAENDIQQLYISIDRDETEQKWKDDIKYYRLTGTHIRANSEFSQNLMIMYSKNEKSPGIAIPWYILIDEKGNILEEHAKRPSQLVAGEKLW